MSASLEAQVAERIAEVRAARRDDPLAASLLAAYYLRRASALPPTSQARVEAELTQCVRSDPEARRYVELRSMVTDLARRARPPRVASPERSLDALIASQRRADLAHRVMIGSIIAGALSTLIGLALIPSTIGALALVGGFGLATLGGAMRWIVRLTQYDAEATTLRSSDELAHVQMAREAQEALDAVRAGDDARWARALIAAHPALAFADLDAR